jgi:hypothetical protein
MAQNIEIVNHESPININQPFEVTVATQVCFICRKAPDCLCYSCKRDVCLNCVTSNNPYIFYGQGFNYLFKTNKKNSLDNILPYRCFLFIKFSESNKMSTGSFIVFVIFYIIMGWIVDLLLLIACLFALICICILLVVFLLIYIPLHYLIISPIYLLVWVTCLKKRRRCIKCTEKIVNVAIPINIMWMMGA